MRDEKIEVLKKKRVLENPRATIRELAEGVEIVVGACQQHYEIDRSKKLLLIRL